MKKKTWEAICAIRGWQGKGSAARFAEEINITRQYAYGIINGTFGCSSNVMRKIIDLVGIKESCWCHMFDKFNLKGIDPNHPIYNQAKFNGEVPYDPLSLSADLRAQDYKTETRGLENA